MKDKITFIIPGLPPSTNNLYLQRGSVRVLNPDAVRWKADVAKLVRAQRAAAGLVYTKADRVALEIRYYAARVWTWDLDGKLKLLIDAVFAGLSSSTAIIDDRYVVSLTATKSGVGKGTAPQTEITVIRL